MVGWSSTKACSWAPSFTCRGWTWLGVAPMWHPLGSASPHCAATWNLLPPLETAWGYHTWPGLSSSCISKAWGWQERAAIPICPAQVPKPQPWPSPPCPSPPYPSQSPSQPRRVMLNPTSPQPGKAKPGRCRWGGTKLGLLLHFSPTAWGARTAYEIWDSLSQTGT